MIFDVFPYLENDRVILKKIEPKDKPALEAMLHEEAVYRYEPTYLPELLSASCEEFIRCDCDRLFNEKDSIILGIYLKDAPDEFTGIAELYGYSTRRNKISIGYRLRQEFWHRGIATSVVSLLKSYILNDLKLERITAHVRVENHASEKCLSKNGFIQRRDAHKEDWGFKDMIIALKLVVYPEGDIRL